MLLLLVSLGRVLWLGLALPSGGRPTAYAVAALRLIWSAVFGLVGGVCFVDALNALATLPAKKAKYSSAEDD